MTKKKKKEIITMLVKTFNGIYRPEEDEWIYFEFGSMCREAQKYLKENGIKFSWKEGYDSSEYLLLK